ncbi:MAG: 4-oxalocrotonate tautomerase [Cellvibrionaceae bacterium]|nr:4-oxalocrotonate tautomerase [Cellvibrionaceae bacterium]|tara:strand:- start:21322 stop:21540 length:219 start_codon:yes stop_codon:yes gene_type:complete
MPFITYSTVAGALSDDKKAELSEALTNAVTSTLGEGFKRNVWVTINELPEGSFYIGGHPLLADVLREKIEQQ